MPKCKVYSTDLKEKIVSLYNNGIKQIQISRDLNIPRATISKIIKKFQKRVTVECGPKSGRPRKTNNTTDRIVQRMSKQNPEKTATEINAELKKRDIAEVIDRTIRNRLRESGLFGRSPLQKPLLSKPNMMKRLNFSKEHVFWTPGKWNTVLWSDECKFQLFRSDGKHYVRRPKGKRYNAKYQLPTVKHGGGSVMVWACFSRPGVGPIFRIDGIMDRYRYLEISCFHMLKKKCQLGGFFSKTTIRNILLSW